MVEYYSFTGYRACREHLAARLREPPPSRIQILTGPRQVGKTTLLLELAEMWPGRAVYAAADAPEAALPGFWERTWADAERLARTGSAIVLLDELHHVPDWSTRLKGEWDRLRRRRLPLHVVVTGSSALMAGAGSRESLAGRFERTVLNHWSARSIAQTFGIPPVEAAEAVATTGGYPGAFPLRGDQRRWRAYVRDAILEPALGRDILATRTVHRPALLRQLFALAAGMPASIVSLQKLQGQIQDPGALETLAHYLDVLADAFLVVGLEKFSPRVHRRRAAPPKLVVLDNALLGAIDPAGPPDARHDPARFGAWVENACLAFAINEGQRVSYWREEPFEVDAVIDGTWGRWAIEVTTGVPDSRHVRGLAEFTKKHPEYKPLLVASSDRSALPVAGIAAVTWRQFLLDGPGGGARPPFAARHGQRTFASAVDTLRGSARR
jgi:predicted AAA+ superfamily ATPase